MAVVFVASPESLPHGLECAEPTYDSLLDSVSKSPPDEDVVLVVRTAAAERVARGLRMSLNTSRIGIYRTEAPPTVFFMLAATLRSEERRVGKGRKPQGSQRHEHDTVMM